MESDQITVSLYENEVPSFVEAELDRLYGNIYSSLVKFTLDHSIENVNTYVARRSGEIISVLLFRCQNATAKVMNERVRIEQEEVLRFANTIFNAFRRVNVISFNAVQTNIRELRFPYQRFNMSEDIVVLLPDTVEEYLVHLGKATRKNIKRHMSRLKRSFPSFSYRVYSKEEVDEQHVRAIIHLHQARMVAKHRISLVDEEETQHIIQLVRRCGMVGVAAIDGRICGGQICYQVGTNYFMTVIAHDCEYDDHRLGTLCCYLTICACIAQGGKECHLLWGRDAYKYELSGVRRDLESLVVYRSRIHVMSNVAIALQGLFRGAERELRLWLHNDSAVSRLAIKALNHLRG